MAPRITRKAVLDVLPKYAKSRKRNANCVYVTDDGTGPVCLVGTILCHDFGVAPETLLPANRLMALMLPGTLPRLTKSAARVLDDLQDIADNEGEIDDPKDYPTWGSAVRKVLGAAK